MLLAVLLSTLTQAEERPKNVVLADLGLHVVGVGYQRRFGDYVAGQVSFNLWVPWTMNANFLGLSGVEDKGTRSGVVARGRAFFYPEGEAPIGPWVSPFVQVGAAQYAKAQGLTEAVGAAVGWSWLLVRRVLLALGLGIQYHLGLDFSRLYLHADINLGFAF